MTAKHTPPPWVAHAWEGDNRLYWTPTQIMCRDGGIVAEMRSDDGNVNANILAAAPDMLEALKNLSTLSDAIWVKMSNSEGAALKAAWSKADAAIAKAEGGKP